MPSAIDRAARTRKTIPYSEMMKNEKLEAFAKRRIPRCRNKWCRRELDTETNRSPDPYLCKQCHEQVTKT